MLFRGIRKLERVVTATFGRQKLALGMQVSKHGGRDGGEKGAAIASERGMWTPFHAVKKQNMCVTVVFDSFDTAGVTAEQPSNAWMVSRWCSGGVKHAHGYRRPPWALRR